MLVRGSMCFQNKVLLTSSDVLDSLGVNSPGQNRSRRSAISSDLVGLVGNILYETT